MSAMSPFCDDVEHLGTMDQHPSVFEDALEDGETWYGGETAPITFADIESEKNEWWGTDAETENLDFHGAEDESAHPILSVFPLPAAVLEALSGGLSSLAVGLAATAGYKDVNQLTDIVFYFRHPELIGRRIQADQRDLAAEWVSIRDRIVWPAMASAPVAVSPGVTAHRPVPLTDTPAKLSADRLRWSGASADELAFMKAVYRRQAAQRANSNFVMDLPKSALATIEGHEARRDAAEAVQSLLAEARAALAEAHPTVRIGILSAYRPATRQFEIWQGRNPGGGNMGSGFPFYYRKAIDERIVEAGDFSPDAVNKVAEFLRKYIASPGHSKHQDGLAFDFGTAEGGRSLRRLKAGPKAWFHNWLEKNRDRLHLMPLATEPWHWTYQPPSEQSEVLAGEDWSTEVAGSVVPAGRCGVRRFWTEEGRKEPENWREEDPQTEDGEDRYASETEEEFELIAARADEPEADEPEALGEEEIADSLMLLEKPNARPDLGVSASQVGAYDWAFRKAVGARFKALVEWAAKEVGMNPGLVAENLLAEARRSTYLTKDRVSSYEVGADDFYAKRRDIAAKVRAFKKLRWSEASKRSHDNDALKPRQVITVDFPSGGDALLGNAIYVKHGEAVLQAAAAAAGRDFSSLPVEVRFALVRLACNAGHGRAIRALADANSGGDVLIRRPQKDAGPQRMATIHAARAMHLSSSVFGVTPI